MEKWVHLCIDMQRVFSEDTPWHVPWMARVSDEIVAIAERDPERAIFTRFIPPVDAADMPGMWRQYYEKWSSMTRAVLPPDLLDLVPEVKRFTPPARIFDKQTYSPWTDGRLHATLAKESVDTIVMTGGETDVCVLAAVFGAIDLGYRVVLPKDAVCGSADETHDASLDLLRNRFSLQVEMTDTEEVLRRFG